MNKKIQIGVLGFAGKEEYPKTKGPTKKDLEIAQKVGYLLAKAGAIVVTGGKTGVMEFASKGAKLGGGITVGVITRPRKTSNNWIDIEVITGSKIAGFDEVIIPIMCDAVVVIGGGAGTLQEICVSYRNKIPIIILENTTKQTKSLLNKKYLDERKTTKIFFIKNPKDAVNKVINQTKKHKNSLS